MKNQILSAAVALVFITFTSTAFAVSADAEKTMGDMKAMPKEMRLKMAEAHEKMGACLKSEKPMSECKSEMMNSCDGHMGKEGCPMMHHKGGHDHECAKHNK